jgi:phospholipase C
LVGRETQSKGFGMERQSRDNALDHVVVVMFENRSFDNLLGRLYQPGEVAAFEGVAGKELSNPIPDWAEHGADRKVVPYGISPTMNTPWPDPGEEFPHINTQLFGVLDEANRGILQPETTFNTPRTPTSSPPWMGSSPTTSACSWPSSPANPPMRSTPSS